MGRRLRIDVLEGESVLVLVNFLEGISPRRMRQNKQSAIEAL